MRHYDILRRNGGFFEQKLERSFLMAISNFFICSAGITSSHSDLLQACRGRPAEIVSEFGMRRRLCRD
jgi:hypothetical protein